MLSINIENDKRKIKVKIEEVDHYKETIQEIREYQKEIFENCKEKNSIIFLETGTGKTLISIMLIDYYLTKFRSEKKVYK